MHHLQYLDAQSVDAKCRQGYYFQTFRLAEDILFKAEDSGSQRDFIHLLEANELRTSPEWLGKGPAMRLLFVLCKAQVHKLRGNHYQLFRATEESIALSGNSIPGWLIDWLIGLD